MIIEWNTHLFSRDTSCYPFHPQARYVPPEENRSDDPLADYLRRMDEERIDRAVVVHPEPYGDDHRLILAVLAKEPERLRGTCLFLPEDPDAPRKIEALVAKQPLVVATRFHALRGMQKPYFEGFSDSNVRAMWETAARLELIVELHIGPSFAAQAAALIEAHPSTTVLVDHLAEPLTGNPVEYADVLDLARFDNVYMKLSGLNHFSDDAPLYLDARPFTRRVVDAFGPDRMVWGSGTPAIVDAHMEGYSEADRAKVKGGNLARLLGFGG